MKDAPSELPSPLIALGDPDESPDLGAWREFVALTEASAPAALVTVIADQGSSPRGMGAVMTVRGDGTIVGTIGGGNLEKAVIEQALESIRDGRTRRLHYDYFGGRRQNIVKSCRGQTELLIQPGPRPHELHVFGAGHVGVPLAAAARLAGFSVHVIDEREGYPRPHEFAPDIQVHHAPFVEYAESLRFDERRTWIVLVTYGHAHDEAVLKSCLGRPWRYLGMIASRAKVALVYKSLYGRAAQSEDLAAIRAPIGLDLGGRSPGEIAISIVAEMLAVRNGKDSIAPLSVARAFAERQANRANGHGSVDASVDSPQTLSTPERQL